MAENCCLQITNALCTMFIGRSSVGAKICSGECCDCRFGCCWHSGEFDAADQEEDMAEATRRNERRREQRAAAKAAAGRPAMRPSEPYAQPASAAGDSTLTTPSATGAGTADEKSPAAHQPEHEHEQHATTDAPANPAASGADKTPHRSQPSDLLGPTATTALAL